MPKPAIEVEKISKSYRLGITSAPSLQQAFSSWWHRQKEGISQTSSEPGTLWALKDISFSVDRGEVMGIVGRNGAGKSTLLKILSKITAPTSGRAVLRGRVGSLLEIGVGFHQDLTGRENIYLNGAILGMRKKEIDQKFDEIIHFSELEKFIDTPVKRYSSGMYVRLAFAVAAHLEPEILFVDEILAVGDLPFQKKCLGKMSDVASEGRTILFVSHNMGAIASLCSKGILLENGRIASKGPIKQVINDYYDSLTRHDTLQDIKVSASHQGHWKIGEPLLLTLSWGKGMFQPGWECDVSFYSWDGTKVFALESQKLPGFNSKKPGLNRMTFKITNPGLTHQRLRVDVGIRKGPMESYSVVMNNCLTIIPDTEALPPYQRDDTLLVPVASCEVSSDE